MHARRFSLDPSREVLLDSGMLRSAIRSTTHARIALFAVGAALAAGSACGDDDDANRDAGRGDSGSGACLAPLPLDCKPSFEPASYDSIFANVLRPTCGSSASGTQCHGAEGKQAGLVLADRDEAYDSLLGKLDGRPRVVPGDPECSVLIQRIESNERRFRMPLNSDPLDDGLRCAIRLWIAEGAEP